MITLSRYFAFFLFCICTITTTINAIDHSHEEFSEILKKYTSNGFVDYKRLKEEPSRLKAYLASLSTVSEDQFGSFTTQEQIAFLINLYNSATLQLIIDHYPIKTIRDIGWFWFYKGPWHQDFIFLFGELTNLNHIEHELLRRNYTEPRIHFALVCAAQSCPQLRHEPYTAEKLDKQLNEQAFRFLNNSGKNFIEYKKKVIFLSYIFSWFEEDFTKEADSLKSYVTPFLDYEGNKDELKEYRVKFLKYNWKLNDWERI
jgi:hypothetical protein